MTSKMCLTTHTNHYLFSLWCNCFFFFFFFHSIILKGNKIAPQCQLSVALAHFFFWKPSRLSFTLIYSSSSATNFFQSKASIIDNNVKSLFRSSLITGHWPRPPVSWKKWSWFFMRKPLQWIQVFLHQVMLQETDAENAAFPVEREWRGNSVNGVGWREGLVQIIT